MKHKKTYFFAAFTFSVLLAVYFFDYRSEEKKQAVKQALILNYDPAQINYVQILKPSVKIALQKNESGWALLEPIQDFGDSDNVEELLKTFSKERQISVVKETEAALSDKDLQEYGLDKPSAVFNFKNNLGQTKSVSVGSVKNFEGNSYIRIDSENKIIIAEPVWFIRAENDLIHYREKKLFRSSLAQVKSIKVKSLRDNFELKQTDGKWVSSLENYELDQNKVREVLKKLTDTNIVEYVFEGEPSATLVKEKGLDISNVTVELLTEDAKWSVALSLNAEQKTLYALTEHPTYLVKLDVGAWELFGNLNSDQLRDRDSALSFNLNEVQKIYYKNDQNEMNIVADSKGWNLNSSDNSVAKINDTQIEKTINKIHDLKISEFVDNSRDKSKFEGKNMLILKSATEKLVLQLNWGPSFKITKAGEEKEYYYARTQLSNNIFALEKKLLDSLEFDKFTAKKSPDSQVQEKNGEKIE